MSIIEGCLGRLVHSQNYALKTHNEEKSPMPTALVTLQNEYFLF